MEEISAGLAAIGLGAAHIHTEPFGPAPGADSRHRSNAPADAPPTPRRTRKRPDDRVRAQQPRDPVERRLREPARTRRSMRRPRPLVVPHRRLPHLRDDAHRRQPSTTTPTQSNPPPTAARSSAAHGRTTTWCSICDVTGKPCGLWQGRGARPAGAVLTDSRGWRSRSDTRHPTGSSGSRGRGCRLRP